MKYGNMWDRDALIRECGRRGLDTNTHDGFRKTADELRATLRADDARMEGGAKPVRRRRRSAGAL